MAPTGVFWLSLVGCLAPVEPTGPSSGRDPGSVDTADDDGPVIDLGGDGDEGSGDGPIDLGGDGDSDSDGDGDRGGDSDGDGDRGGDSDGDADQPGGEGEGEGEDEPPGVELTADEQDLFDAINDARRENGLDPVVIDERLLCAARNHARDVGGSGACGHVGADGSWPWDRAQACGYPQDDWTVNEIAAGPGFTSGDEAVWGWSQSPGHWAAIVHTEATSLGVGVESSCYIALFDCCVAGG
ncbi:MAG: CAP domain-containing protein [Deltaproteobacteria bacterium]|nr:CAP domain-containing protein [Deltaproteobacteria bacterium]